MEKGGTQPVIEKFLEQELPGREAPDAAFSGCQKVNVSGPGEECPEAYAEFERLISLIKEPVKDQSTVRGAYLFGLVDKIYTEASKTGGPIEYGPVAKPRLTAYNVIVSPWAGEPCKDSLPYARTTSAGAWMALGLDSFDKLNGLEERNFNSALSIGTDLFHKFNYDIRRALESARIITGNKAYVYLAPAKCSSSMSESSIKLGFEAWAPRQKQIISYNFNPLLSLFTPDHQAVLQKMFADKFPLECVSVATHLTYVKTSGRISAEFFLFVNIHSILANVSLDY